MKRLIVASLLACGLYAAPAPAAVLTYGIDWTGSDGYALSGQFTFDSSAGSEVRSTEVKSLYFDVTQNGATLGRWTLQDNTHSLFNFNFNAATGTFFTGGDLLSDSGQVWNYYGSIDAGRSVLRARSQLRRFHRAPDRSSASPTICRRCARL